MPDATPHSLAELSDFLAALRLSGVPVGPGELARLQHLFTFKPRLQRQDLQHLLSALLVKTPAQHDVFAALFADWCPDHEADWPVASLSATPTHAAQQTPPVPPAPDVLAPPSDPPMSRRRAGWSLLAGALLLLGAVLLWPRSMSEMGVARTPDAQVPHRFTATADATTPVEQVWFWRAEVKPQPIHVPRRLGALELALLGLAALALAVVLWWRYRRDYRPIVAPPRRYVGARWQPLPPPARDDSALLAARERRQLVWQIEQFVAEEPTHRLDLPQTVNATARAGGFVHLHFQPTVYERDVWFWLDRQLQRSTPRTAVQQLLTTLAAAGLQARQGLFTDVPDRLDWPEQPAYQPEHEEGAGRQALVVICTDGVGLEQRLTLQRSQRDTERLLRSLQRWPRLCFVDCGTPGGRLAAVLEPYGLDTIALEDLPAWLGGVVRPAPEDSAPDPGLYGAARLWAAAVALGGEQADTASAQSLRVALNLDVSPWAVDQVLDLAQQPGERQRLITWLLRRDPLDAQGKLQPQSLAQQTLDWWQQRYLEAAQRLRAQENPLLPWEHSLAHQRWQMELAVLRLYRDPEGAAQQLAYLADETLRADIHQHLAEYADAAQRQQADRQTPPLVYLPWHWRDLAPVTQHRLHQLGFAAALYTESAPPVLKNAPRLVLACTILLALALSASAAALQRWLAPDPPRFLCPDTPCNHPAMLAQTVQQRERTARGTYQVTLGSARDAQIEWRHAVPAGAQLPVTWTWHQESNAISLPGSRSVVLRAGRLAQPIRACSPDWPLRALVILAVPDAEEQPAVRQLAMHLLDKGSADQVWLGEDWGQHLDAWLGPSPTLNRHTQILVLLPDAAEAEPAAARLATHTGPWAVATSADVAGLAHALAFAGKKGVEAVSPRLQVQRRQGQVWLAGGPQQQPGPAGLVWVQVCPGTFTMGTIDKGEDAMAFKDEILLAPRIVVLSAFQMAETETTQQQAGQTGNLPMVNVDWPQARAMCQQLGGDLPTEAQWEYAARAGSRFQWSFGADAARLGDYAWFAENAKGAQAVRQKQPNPLGLYDMHGNVWEWTRDVYNDYGAGVWVDPLGPADGTCYDLKDRSCRVIRGGSFFSPPVILRSARRAGDQPEDQFVFLGFRCVRVPPQP